MIINGKNANNVPSGAIIRTLRDVLGLPILVAGWDLAFEEMPGFRFFIDERGGDGGGWSISELSSGARVAKQLDREDAIASAKRILAREGNTRFASFVGLVVAEFGELNKEAAEAKSK